MYCNDDIGDGVPPPRQTINRLRHIDSKWNFYSLQKLTASWSDGFFRVPLISDIPPDIFYLSIRLHDPRLPFATCCVTSRTRRQHRPPAPRSVTRNPRHQIC